VATVYLGLGSNLGDRQNNLDQAVEHLQKNGIRILKHSSVIETDPVGGPPQDNFLNAVVKVSTDLPPENLLAVLQSIEKKMGRTKIVINGPRLIDLDILLYDEIEWNTNNLVIPHPRMLERDFVMKPLSEIEPELARDLTDESNQQD